MRTKIEIKDYNKMEPAFIETKIARFKDDPAPRSEVIDGVPAAISANKGGETATKAPDRTAPALKMVLFAQLGGSPSEKETGAYLGLIRALRARGHRPLVLERQQSSKKKLGESVFYS